MRGEARRFGGKRKLLASALLEFVHSMLLAPVRMLFHTQFVLTALTGWRLDWKSPPRNDDATCWREAISRHGLHTLLAIAWIVAIVASSQAFAWWLTPILVGLLGAIPLSVLSSRVAGGIALRRRGLLLTPEEVRMPRVLREARRAAQVVAQRNVALRKAVVDGDAGRRVLSALPTRTAASGAKAAAEGLADRPRHRRRSRRTVGGRLAAAALERAGVCPAARRGDRTSGASRLVGRCHPAGTGPGGAACSFDRPARFRVKGVGGPPVAGSHLAMVDDIATLRRILASARTIAVVGLSAEWHRPSFFAAKYMQEHGYRIVPVNPRYERILGERCWPSLEAIDFQVDMVDVFRRSSDVLPIAEQAVAIGAKALWQQIGVANAEADRLAESAGLDSVLNRCVKIEHARLFGGLHWAGVNTGVVTARRSVR